MNTTRRTYAAGRIISSPAIAVLITLLLAAGPTRAGDVIWDGGALDSGVTIQLLLSKTHKGYWRVYKIQLAPPPAPAAPGAEFGAPS